jgi:hypothetical protein
MKYLTLVFVLLFAAGLFAQEASDQDQSEKRVGSSPVSQAEQNTSGSGFGMGAAVGAVVVDGQVYNQIGVRPELSFGKFGIMLDLSLYIDGEGNIASQYWDSPQDILEKIYYMRWGQKGDPFYVKVGAIDNYRLGFGLLMNRYSNTIQYPSVIRVGGEMGFKAGGFGVDVMVNNINETFDSGGVFAGRVSYDVLGDLQIGVSVVYDRNQYKGFKDKDGDGAPDEVDDFPKDAAYQIDTDGDGVPDSKDPDRDGNGYTDNVIAPNDSSILNDRNFSKDRLKKVPFNINSNPSSQVAYAVDLSYPIIQYDYLNLTLYSQAAKFGDDGGYGFTVPGFWAKFLFVDLYGEYRIFQEKFIPEYFNTTYEVDRSIFVTDSTGNIVPRTKKDVLMAINQTAQGYVIGANFDIGKFVVFGAEYQNMTYQGSVLKDVTHLNTIRGNLDINTSMIPKINRAGAYYYQNQVKNLFELSPGTITGIQLEYELAPGAAILLDYRQTYWDKNGDGRVTADESDRTTIVQSVFRF